MCGQLSEKCLTVKNAQYCINVSKAAVTWIWAKSLGYK